MVVGGAADKAEYWESGQQGKGQTSEGEGAGSQAWTVKESGVEDGQRKAVRWISKDAERVEIEIKGVVRGGEVVALEAAHDGDGDCEYAARKWKATNEDLDGGREEVDRAKV